MAQAKQLHAQSLLSDGEDPDDNDHILTHVKMSLQQSYKEVIN